MSNLEIHTTLGFRSENTEITAEHRSELESNGVEGYEALIEAFPGYTEAQSMVSGTVLADWHDYDESFYPVHLSSAETVEELRRLRADGYNLWAETCPHYLVLTANECDGMMKINPPIRGSNDQEALWEGVADGTINCLGSDHCAKPLSSKQQDSIWDIANAFPGSGTLLPLILSEGVNAGRIPLTRCVELTAMNPAKAWNLFPKKVTSNR